MALRKWNTNFRLEHSVQTFWKLGVHFFAVCAFPEDQDEDMSIPFYPAIHRSRKI